MTLETGIRGEQSVLVTAANTAKTMGSGTLEVFATPALVALAEKTCWMSVADALDAKAMARWAPSSSWSTPPPPPVGMTVTCESELVAVEGRKLTFKVALHDEKKALWAAAPTNVLSSTTPSSQPRRRQRRGKTPSVLAEDAVVTATPVTGKVHEGFGIQFLSSSSLAPMTENTRNYSSSVSLFAPIGSAAGQLPAGAARHASARPAKGWAACTLARNSSKYIAL